MKTILYLLATTACKASCYQPRATAWVIVTDGYAKRPSRAKAV